MVWPGNTLRLVIVFYMYENFQKKFKSFNHFHQITNVLYFSSTNFTWYKKITRVPLISCKNSVSTNFLFKHMFKSNLCAHKLQFILPSFLVKLKKTRQYSRDVMLHNSKKNIYMNLFCIYIIWLRNATETGR